MLRALFFILLIEGFVTISVEILAIRQLMPFYGSNIIITSMVIGIFLLFLAIGYWRGGTHHDHFFKKISRNFSFSLVWVGFGLSYSFVAWYYLLANVKFSTPYLINLTLYLLIIIAPTVYWLGQTIPLTTNLFSEELRVSHISGRALFVSTIGSFLGAILTSLILFHYLGVAWTVFINCLLLFLLVLYLMPYSRFSIFTVLGLSFALILIFQLNVNVEKVFFKLTNNYANYKIETHSDFSKTLQINNSLSSKITPNNKALSYIEFLRNILFKHMDLKNKKILVIGAGGFTFSAAGTHQNDITYVDIDPALKKLAEEHFLKKPIKGKFIGQDARQFLQQSHQRYDLIISDVYSHQISIPPSLLTIEYFQKIAEHLTPSGLFIANIIANPFFKDDYSQRLHQTLTSVFPYCSIIPLNWGSKVANIIYICNAKNQKASIYSDNYNQSTIDFFKLHQQ
ncbi:methyltransferase domain-containing protein [Legionella israelensis]|uniref:fused MFS/spermidine synthase n=1 Tax=Legionella israelensis TaxID=454 RepID=UPI00117C338C|nr:fused MFS/spermidine synthase [Legionella israelensis]QDP71929.1 methyltransferase domain-containing protein [Legionella israelensis]